MQFFVSKSKELRDGNTPLLAGPSQMRAIPPRLTHHYPVPALSTLTFKHLQIKATHGDSGQNNQSTKELPEREDALLLPKLVESKQHRHARP